MGTSANVLVATSFTVIVGILLVAATSAIAVLPSGPAVPYLGGAATLLGILVTCVGVIQAVYKWGQRSRMHKSIGSSYANLRRKVQLFLLDSPVDYRKIEPIAREASELSTSGELVSLKIWKSVDTDDIESTDLSPAQIASCVLTAPESGVTVRPTLLTEVEPRARR